MFLPVGTARQKGRLRRTNKGLATIAVLGVPSILLLGLAGTVPSVADAGRHSDAAAQVQGASVVPDAAEVRTGGGAGTGQATAYHFVAAESRSFMVDAGALTGILAIGPAASAAETAADPDALAALRLALRGAEAVRQNAPDEVLATEDGTDLVRATARAAALLAEAAPRQQDVDRATNQLQDAADAVHERSESYESLLEEIELIAADGSAAVVALSVPDGSVLVSIDPTEPFTAASTYKIFVAASMIEAVEGGEWAWSSPLSGRTLAQCFDAMIVESDNECPEAWFAAVGVAPVEEAASRLGATETTFEWRDFQTTAADLAHALLVLEGADNMTPDSHNRLMDAMERQDYREGIPAAIEPDGVVADKVGFLDWNLHDAAILHTRKGDFVLVVMTDGLSWDAIAQVAAAVYDYL